MPNKNPKEIAIQEFVLSTNAWPTAKATKNGDHVAEVFIPLKQASAIFVRKNLFDFFGRDAERIENVPVFITLPKKCEAI